MGHRIFISGGTGYVGTAVIPRLVARGWQIRALARRGSERKLPLLCEVVTGSALEGATFARQVQGCDTYLHLVGTPHPTPWKGDQFRAVDLLALRESVAAARDAGVAHFIYISVAHPAPVMKSYIEVRSTCERHISAAGVTATILRPWYILGPGHWWPVALKPVYAAMSRIDRFKDAAERLGLLTLAEMREAIVWAAENPPTATRVLQVADIRNVRA